MHGGAALRRGVRTRATGMTWVGASDGALVDAEDVLGGVLGLRQREPLRGLDQLIG